MRKRILEADKENKLLIGAGNVIKGLKSGQINEIILTPNCLELYAKQIHELASMSNTTINMAEMTNRELGSVCKKPFSISVVGIKKTNGSN